MTAIHEDQPKPGWYAYRPHKDAKWQPAAIWLQGGELVCVVGTDKRREDPHKLWTWLADNKRNPADVKACFATGRWPDEPEPAFNGSNLPSDPFEALLAQIRGKTELSDELLKKHPVVKDQTTCNLFSNLRDELLELNKQADAMFKVEKDPWTIGGKKVDEKFRFRAAVQACVDELRRRFGAFMAAERARLEREEHAKFVAERKAAEAERERIAKENLKLLEDDPVAALTGSQEILPPLPSGPAPVKVQAGGLYGSKSGQKQVWVGTVTDYKKAAGYFINHPDLKAVVDKLAKHAVKDAKGAISIPGVDIKQDWVAT